MIASSEYISCCCGIYQHPAIGVIVHLLSVDSSDHDFNNLRGSILAGLAYGLNKEVLILQEGERGPVPVDIRDFVCTYRNPNDIDQFINAFIPKVTSGIQAISQIVSADIPSELDNIDLGSPFAENEVASLGSYYYKTAQYKKSINGQVQLLIPA